MTPGREPARSMIAAPESAGVEAGAAVLARGGNAVDAAVVCAFVQGVVNPHDAGLGGFAVLTMQEARAAGQAAPASARLLDAPALAGSRASATCGPGGDRRTATAGASVDGEPNKSGYTSICTPGGLRGLARDARTVGHDPPS